MLDAPVRELRNIADSFTYSCGYLTPMASRDSQLPSTIALLSPEPDRSHGWWEISRRAVHMGVRVFFGFTGGWLYEEAPMVQHHLHTDR